MRKGVPINGPPTTRDRSLARVADSARKLRRVDVYGIYVLDLLLSRLFSRKKKATLTTRLSITNGAETRLEK